MGKQDIINEQQRTIAQLQAENATLQGRVVSERVIGGIADLIRVQLGDPKLLAEMNDTAGTIAQVAVFTAERERLEGEMAVNLQTTRYQDYAARFRAEHGPEIKEKLDTVFCSDGTYNRIEEKARADVHGQIQSELVGESEEKIRMELSTPEAKAAIVAKLVERQKAEDPDMAALRERVRQELEGKWAVEAATEAEAQILAEEQQKEAEFKDQLRESQTNTYQMRNYRERIRKDLQTRWGSASLEDVQAAITSEEERAVIAERIKQEAAKLKEVQDNIAVEAWLREFEGPGIDTREILADSKLVIYLGEPGMFTVERQEKDQWNQLRTVKVEVRGMKCRRTLALHSLGDGRYVVEKDSLTDSDSVYVKDDAIQSGTVITVGRKLQENGSEQFDQRISADTELYYDDDTISPGITGTKLPVVNIELDGISARKFEHIEHID